MNRMFAAIVAAVLVIGVPASARAAEAAGSASPATAAAGPKAAAFQELFGPWKKILREMRDLQLEYKTAGVDRRVEISKRYDELIAQGNAMQDKLVAAAIEAYKEAPNADLQIAQFLVGIVSWGCQADDYEKALEIARPLIENKVPAKGILELAGKAAFAAGDFDAAEKYLKEASSAGELEKTARQNLEQIPYYKVEWPKEQKIREAEAKADDLPRVLLKTKHGDIVLELFENQAPNTVANFISLVKKGFYNGLTFHRVLPGFMAQGGCPTGTGTGGPGYKIACECVRDDHRKHFRGSLSMAHAGPDTGGSQFFLTFVPTQSLDGRHTVFGRVVEGIDQLAKIQRRDPEEDGGTEPEKIIEMKVLRDRGHEYVPEKLK